MPDPTKHYSFQGARPAPLPDEIRVPDDDFPGGRLRTGRESFTNEELALAGYAEAPDPPAYDPTTHNPPVWAGGNWTEPAPKSNDQRVAELVALGAMLEERLETYIDAVAKAKRYRSTDRLIGYKGSSNPLWAADAAAFEAWRDTVVGIATTLENSVAAGERDPLTWEQLLDELDDPPWPLPAGVSP